MGRCRSALLLLSVVAGCSGGGHKASTPTDAPPETVTPSTSLPVRAAAECRRALKNPSTFVSALPTTVGAIHAITGGPLPTAHPWGNLYADKADGAFAAWCWRLVSPTAYRSYVVGPGPPIFLDMGTDFPPAPGPLAVT
ncbi:MAG: hypothetical protein QOC79_317 [Actinomycetota bacterium]|nr:hypothetical protein [Actinomycetota bacterium]